MTVVLETPRKSLNLGFSYLHGTLGIFSKDKDVRVYSQGTYIRLEVSAKTPLPDVVLTSKSREKRNKYHQLLNPLVVMEILSKSTKNLDQTQK